MAERDLFAPGHDNAAGLQALAELSPPLFDGYDWLRTEWYDEEAVVRDGSGNLVPIGLPFVVLLLEVVTQAEFQLLRATFGTARRNPITIYTYNKTADAWQTFNGMMEIARPEEIARWDRGHWRDMRLPIVELEAI